MVDLSQILLQGISKKLDKLIELVKDLIRILGNKIKKLMSSKNLKTEENFVLTGTLPDPVFM